MSSLDGVEVMIFSKARYIFCRQYNTIINITLEFIPHTIEFFDEIYLLPEIFYIVKCILKPTNKCDNE